MANHNCELSIVVNPEAAASFHEDGMVIFHTGKGRLFSANGAAARIWAGLCERLPLETIVERISNEYEVSSTFVREHALSFLAQLESHHLIQRGAER